MLVTCPPTLWAPRLRAEDVQLEQRKEQKRSNTNQEHNETTPSPSPTAGLTARRKTAPQNADGQISNSSSCNHPHQHQSCSWFFPFLVPSSNAIVGLCWPKMKPFTLRLVLFAVLLVLAAAWTKEGQSRV